MRSHEAALLAGLDAMLGVFAGAGDSQHFDLSIEYGLVEGAIDPALRSFGSVELADGPTMTYYAAAGRRAIALGGVGLFELDITAGQGRAIVAAGQEALASHSLYVPMLCELLAHGRQHAVHAAVLADDAGRAVLLAGQSGRGKTTAALALAKAGLTLLSDDTCFLLDDGGAVAAWGLRRQCRVRRSTFELLPFLRELPSRPAPKGEPTLVEVGALWPASNKLVRPAAIVLLDAPSAGGHAIGPATKIDACQELLRQNVNATDPSADGPGGSAMRLITRLVGQCSTRRLSAGRDLETLRGVIEPLLRG